MHFPASAYLNLLVPVTTVLESLPIVQSRNIRRSVLSHITPKNHMHDQTLCFEVEGFLQRNCCSGCFSIRRSRHLSHCLTSARALCARTWTWQETEGSWRENDRRQIKQTRDPVVPFARTYDVAQRCLIWRGAAAVFGIGIKVPCTSTVIKCASPSLATGPTADMEAPTDSKASLETFHFL